MITSLPTNCDYFLVHLFDLNGDFMLIPCFSGATSHPVVTSTSIAFDSRLILVSRRYEAVLPLQFINERLYLTDRLTMVSILYLIT